MENLELSDGEANSFESRIRRKLKSSGFNISIGVLILYILLQILLLNAFDSHILILNVPQTAEFPNMAEARISQLDTSIMTIISIGLILNELFLVALFTTAAFVLLKLLGKSPGLDLVYGVICSFLAFVPFLAVSIVLVSMMPAYRIEYLAISSSSVASIVAGLENEAHFQVVKPILFMGWVCFGILLIYMLKVVEDLDLRQALIAGGLPVFAYILYEYRTIILELLHRIV